MEKIYCIQHILINFLYTRQAPAGMTIVKKPPGQVVLGDIYLASNQ